ncbi:GGDEF domain-containing protein [Paracoccus sp. (in: a-proteobacteria)]|uniref:GGDEF domain-containing protein n=1 Tax=Paracoccus sp. TaxID=267 RepID=UPI00396CB845
MTLSGHHMPMDSLIRLLPMHLWLGRHDRVLSVGPTLAKVVPGLPEGLEGRLTKARGGGKATEAIRLAVERDKRLFLRVSHAPDLVLRGHGVEVGDGGVLVNLGFGIGLHRAIRKANLTDYDFAPSELAMEFLFLHEAKRGILNELTRFNDQLEQSRKMALLQAQTDPLTGLANRRGLEIALAATLRTVAEGAGAPFALIHMDLDHFKQVNDRLGHKAGDDLLRDVGRILREQIRKADTAARIGGDEFVLILLDVDSQSALQELAARIISAIKSLSPPELGDLKVSASLGIVVWRSGRTTCADSLSAMADEALYASKRQGRGCATIV